MGHTSIPQTATGQVLDHHGGVAADAGTDVPATVDVGGPVEVPGVAPVRHHSMRSPFSFPFS